MRNGPKMRSKVAVQLVVGRGPQRHGLADEADGFVTGPVAIADIAARSEGRLRVGGEREQRREQA